jgi:hypothetical protein
MTHRLNPRGYTWQTYLRIAGWRLALVAGFILVLWRGTTRELDWYVPTMLVIIFLSVGWDLVGRHVGQGWRSK